MNRPTRRRVTGGLGAVIVLALLTTAALASSGGAAPAAPARSRATAQGPPAPDLTLAAQSEVVAGQDSFLLGVRVVGAPPGGRLRVSVLPSVDDRETFDDTLGLATNSPRGELFNLDLIPASDLPTDPDGSQRLGVAFGGRGQAGAGLVRQPGVYPVQVRLLDADDGILAGLTTHLVRVPPPDEPIERLRVAVVLPLHARPAVQPDGSSRLSARDVAGLRSVLDTLSAHPLVAATIAPTPETMDAVASSTRETGAALLTEARLVAGSLGRQVITSPFVRLDTSAWVAEDLTDELRQQLELGTSVLANILGTVDGRTRVGDGDLTPQALDLLRRADLARLVMPEEALTPLEPRGSDEALTQPYVVATDEGAMPAVSIDDGLRAAFTRTHDPMLGAHQLVAELAVVAAEEQDVPRGVVVSPPDDWRPSPQFLRTFLDGLTAESSLVTPVQVEQLFAQVPPAQGRRGRARDADLVRTLRARSAPSLGEFPTRLRDARLLLASYGSMVGPASARVQPFGDRLLVAGSSDLSERRQLTMIQAVTADLNREFSGVSTSNRERVTLTAREADFPLSLQNRLGYPVDVVVDLQASNRLSFPDGNRIPVRLVGERTRVKLRVQAPVSGDSPLRVTVRSADGTRVLATSRYTVRSTSVSGVGLVLTAGAALFLVVWWARHLRSSSRSRRNAPAPA